MSNRNQAATRNSKRLIFIKVNCCQYQELTPFSKLNDAEGEAAETQTHIEIARRCNYVTDTEAANLDGVYEEILSMLATMANHPEKWCL